MLARRIVIFLAVSLWLSGQTFAGESPKISLDPWGNINVFQIKQNELKASGFDFPKPQTLYSFTQEVSTFDIKSENTKFYLVYSTPDPALGSSIYLTYSRDNGKSFSKPRLISKDGKDPSLAVKKDLIWIAWAEKDNIKLMRSEDGGVFFSLPQTLAVTDESLSSPSLLIDKNNNAHLTFVSKNPDIDLNKIRYRHLTPSLTSTELVGSEPKVLFESYDNLTNLKIKSLSDQDDKVIVFWQKEYLQRIQPYFVISLNGGRNFGRERTFELQHDLIDLGFIKDKLSAVSYAQRPIIKEIKLMPLAAPQLLLPASGSVLNSKNLKLIYAPSGDDALLCTIDLSQDKYFTSSNTRSFEQLVSILTLETVKYDLPSDIPDGKYFLRITAFDGINTSPASLTQSFTIDNVSPRVLSLEAETTTSSINFKGKASEPLSLFSINNHPVSLDSNMLFETQLPMAAGNNTYTFALGDKAGNLFISTEEVFYNPASPEITVVAPAESEWFKPGSTILIEARVSDLQGDIKDEGEAQIIIEGQVLPTTISYDQADSGLFGFIQLPANLTDGKHTGSIILSDIDGNKGKGDFVINIDGSPPQITQIPGQKCFTNSQTKIVLPLADSGAGLDLSGTIITISDISFEGKVSAEGNGLTVICETPLIEGTYEVNVIPRDLVGNITDATSFSLVVDTTPPKLTITKSYDSQTDKDKILIEGDVEETHLSTIKVSINKNIVKSFKLNSDHFSVEVNLLAGNNDILIEALDQAGNTDSENISTFTTFQAPSTILTSLAHGPNPFSPAKNLAGAFSTHGKGMVFAYALSQPADLMIRIYDITGTLIWVKEVTSASSGVTAWSGIDQFGQIAANGIYPYFFSVSANGMKETRRGKIIVNQ
ncbi:MAG: hypothetical protein ABIH22_01275 [Candidatus Margulisiibacteriota bacterium]